MILAVFELFIRLNLVGSIPLTSRTHPLGGPLEDELELLETEEVDELLKLDEELLILLCELVEDELIEDRELNETLE